MSPGCPFRHVSYAAWRLRQFKSLFDQVSTHGSSNLSFLRPFSVQPQPVPLLPGNTRCASGKTTPDDNNIGPSVEPKEQRATSQHAESLIGPREGLKNVSAAAKGRPRGHKNAWTPFSESGRHDLTNLVHSIRADVTSLKREDIVPLSLTGLSKALPESPIFRAARKKRHRKLQPELAEAKQLRNNPWAKILAAPLRHCNVTGVRLPRDLLVPWSLTRNPQDDTVYLMPADLAAMDKLRQPKALRKGIAKARAGTVNGETGDWDTSATQQASVYLHPASVDQSITDVNPSIEHRDTRPRIHMLTSSLVLHHLTLNLTSENPQSPGNWSRRKPRKGQVSRIIPHELKHKIDALVHFTNYNRSTPRAKSTPLPESRDNAVANKFTMTEAAESAEHDLSAPPAWDVGSYDKIMWQGDIEMRVLKILRERVLAAFEGFAKLNSSPRVRHRESCLAIDSKSLQSGKMIFDPSPGLAAAVMSSSGEEDVNTVKIADTVPGESSLSISHTPGSTSLDGHITTYAAGKVTAPSGYGALVDSLGGSVLLHIESDPDPSLRHTNLPKPPDSSVQLSAHDLHDGHHPLLPKTILVNDTMRLPIFSLRQLLGPALFAEAWPKLRREYDIFQPLLTHKGKKAQCEGSLETKEYTDSYFLLIKCRASRAGYLIEELWRLWRYLGGNLSAGAEVREENIKTSRQMEMDELERDRDRELNKRMSLEGSLAKKRGPLA